MMPSVIKIALRNLLRYKRRTYLTAAIILFGVSLVIVFSGFANSFRKNMVVAITGGLLGDLQVHANGYVASIENLPLYIGLDESEYRELTETLGSNKEIAAYAPRIKFSGMISSYVKTSGLRVIAVDPVSEMRVCPNLTERISPAPVAAHGLLRQGEIILPETIANGLNLTAGSDVVLLANNEDGSINAVTLKVAGTSGSVTDPSGRDAYICLEDAKTLLRMEQLKISEVAIRLNDFGNLGKVSGSLRAGLGNKTKDGEPIFEVHTWQQLSPIANFVKILDLFLLIAKLILVIIVLISVMNVMVMSVYERVNEIGTVSAIGTIPSRILGIFLLEGTSLGVIGAIAGTFLGLSINAVIGLVKPTFIMGHMMKIVLAPYLSACNILQAWLIVILIAGLASLEPAIKASKLQPVDAMRHN